MYGEQERGILMKYLPVSVKVKHPSEEKSPLNLIDTLGHVNLSYGVSRSVAACENALLLIDAPEDVEAQTAANRNLAIGQKMVIIPVVNKINLESARSDVGLSQLEDVLAIRQEEVFRASAKSGVGIAEIFGTPLAIRRRFNAVGRRFSHTAGRSVSGVYFGTPLGR
jgi:GTP-binding protein LepA